MEFLTNVDLWVKWTWGVHWLNHYASFGKSHPFPQANCQSGEIKRFQSKLARREGLRSKQVRHQTPTWGVPANLICEDVRNCHLHYHGTHTTRTSRNSCKSNSVLWCWLKSEHAKTNTNVAFNMLYYIKHLIQSLAQDCTL